MANVRALLRTELATRRITHPFASYTATGNLSCNLCKQTIKSHSLWDTHLRSAAHLARLSQQQQEKSKSAPTGPGNGSRKRRLDQEDDAEEDVSAESREKRPRKDVDGPLPEEDILAEEPPEGIDDKGRDDSSEANEAMSKGGEMVDENEWAAFEQDIAQVVTTDPSPDITNNAINVLNAPSTISAPALSASELQQLQIQGSGSQKNGDATESEMEEKRRKAKEDAEAEREDARRRLEEEWDVMHSYEERVRRLKMRREELRQKRDGDVAIVDDGGGGGGGAGDTVGPGNDDDDDENEMRNEDGNARQLAVGKARKAEQIPVTNGDQHDQDGSRIEEGSESGSDESEEVAGWNNRWDPF